MELNFTHGAQEYTVRGVKGDVELYFNPTDGEFVQRLYHAFDMLDKKQEAYNEEIQKCGNNAKIFEIARKRSDEMRTVIDGIFEEPICEKIFGRMNLYALSTDGLYIWAELLLALMDATDEAFSKSREAAKARLKKYTEKYRR